MLITQTRIRELRKTIPHADADAIKATFGERATAEQIEDLNAYLNRYAAPVEGDSPCVACGEPYAFQWGIQHGEGDCHSCRWPGTLYHFINDRHGKELVVIRGLLLWYHPDGIDSRHD